MAIERVKRDAHLYAVAIGSNRRHGRFGRPVGVVEAAIARLDAEFELFDAAPIILNKAIGGAGRDFANSVVLLTNSMEPAEMLAALKTIEREFGRRPGRRWGERVLDLDLAAWDGGRYQTRGLTIPHARLAERDFVLGPLAGIAPDWRIAGPLSVRHLLSRLGKRRPSR
jgi:2-amino-4-hydroxy-6-hydroxymethyldihydropteridine diphosphokinase